MGTRGFARLTIGGPVKLSVLEHWIDESYSDLEPDDDGLIVIEDDEASYSMFYDLEKGLADAGIAFDRESGSNGEYDSQSLRRFRPGIGDFEYETGGNDEWTITVAEIRAKLAESPEALLAFLNEKYPDLPKLEPITWLPEDAEVDAALGP